MKTETDSKVSELSPEQIRENLEFLERLILQPELLGDLSAEDRKRLLTAAGRLAHPGRDELKRRRKETKSAKRKVITENEKRARAATGIRAARKTAVFSAPLQVEGPGDSAEHSGPKLESPRNCYVCKAEFIHLHSFYDSMCPSCADFNYKKRFQTADLQGQVALITGARLKIGYHGALMMLRSGAKVIVTTRFPVDAALRFSKEDDYPDWENRLHIYGLDLRHTPSVEMFAGHIVETFDRLDILIHNAAQTVRRPVGFYSHLMELETKEFSELPERAQNLLGLHQTCLARLEGGVTPGEPLNQALTLHKSSDGPGMGLRASAALSQIPYHYDDTLSAEKIFPQGKLDADLQQVDLRKTNSWRLKLGEIETSELLEVQLINSIAPFVLSNRLIPLMRKDNTGQKHIVNVTAMEGKFHRFHKADRHPHTNMAKAALNMLTHTSASDLEKDGIYMNAVDTGWVTDEDPVELSLHKQDKHDFEPPLDIVDGAARICDPFIDGINSGKHWCGKFLKDYFPIDW